MSTTAARDTHSDTAYAMTTAATYERQSEHAGYTIHEARTGWVCENWSRYQGTYTGRRMLVPFGFRGIQRGADLSAAWNDIYTVGEIIYEAMHTPKYERTTESIRMLDSGTLVR